MNNELTQALIVLEKERECVLRQDSPDCDRDCKKCDLLLPTETVVEAYDNAIKVIRAIKILKGEE